MVWESDAESWDESVTGWEVQAMTREVEERERIWRVEGNMKND